MNNKLIMLMKENFEKNEWYGEDNFLHILVLKNFLTPMKIKNLKQETRSDKYLFELFTKSPQEFSKEIYMEDTSNVKNYLLNILQDMYVYKLNDWDDSYFLKILQEYDVVQEFSDYMSTTATLDNLSENIRAIFESKNTHLKYSEMIDNSRKQVIEKYNNENKWVLEKFQSAVNKLNVPKNIKIQHMKNFEENINNLYQNSLRLLDDTLSDDTISQSKLRGELLPFQILSYKNSLNSIYVKSKSELVNNNGENITLDKVSVRDKNDFLRSNRLVTLCQNKLNSNQFKVKKGSNGLDMVILYNKHLNFSGVNNSYVLMSPLGIVYIANNKHFPIIKGLDNVHSNKDVITRLKQLKSKGLLNTNLISQLYMYGNDLRKRI